jgi:hypothetical protein
MAQTLLAWPLLLKRQMVVILLMGARPGSLMLLSRKLLVIYLLHELSFETLQRCSHHLGPMQMGRKGARVHPREGMSTSFPKDFS